MICNIGEISDIDLAAIGIEYREAIEEPCLTEEEEGQEYMDNCPIGGHCNGDIPKDCMKCRFGGGE